MIGNIPVVLDCVSRLQSMQRLNRSRKNLLLSAFAILSALSLPYQACAATVATVTTVVASSTSTTAGMPVTATVTVTAGGTPVTNGDVYLCVTPTFDCSVSEAATVLHLSASGTASTPVYAVGTVLLQAEFAGTGTYAPSRSTFGSASEVVFSKVNIPTTTTITSVTGTPGNYTVNASVVSHYLSSVQPEFTSAPINFVDTSNGNYLLGHGTLVGQPETTGLVAGTAPLAGVQPNHVITGDFNTDGFTDVAFANAADNTISVSLANGDGTFQPPVAYNVGHGPGVMAIGYFNNDGNLDLAVVNNTDKTISILFGSSTGAFSVQTATLATGNNPIALISGDIGTDGSDDLVVLNHDDQQIGVFLNNGDGTFQPQATYATGADPRSISLGDIALGAVDTNPAADGILDIAVANFADNNIGILYGNSDGTFQAQTTITDNVSGPVAVSLDDSDDIGFAGLTFLNQTNATVVVISRDFRGEIQPTGIYSLGSGHTPITFIFALGRGSGPSILVLNSDNTVEEIDNTGNYDGTFDTTIDGTYIAPVGVVSLAKGDFDGQGEGLVFGGSATATPMVYLQRAIYTNNYTITGVTVPGLTTSNVIAMYPGDPDQNNPASDPAFLPSQSDPVALTDSPLATATSISISPNHGVAPGGSTTITAGVTPLMLGNYVPTGSFHFMDNGAAISACPDAPIGTGVATCTVASLSAAQHVFSVSYSGDPYFSTSTSGTRALNVSNFSTTALTLSATGYNAGAGQTVVPLGTPVTASIAVTDTTGTGVSGGLVNLCEATAAHCTGTALLGTVQLQTSSGAAPGTATTTLLLPLGTHSVQAVAQGTVPSAPSFSGPKPLTVFSPAGTTTTLASSGSAGNLKLTATVTSSNIVALNTNSTVAITDSSNSHFSASGTLNSPSYSSTFTIGSQYMGLFTPPGSDGVEVLGVIKDLHLADLNGDGVPDMIYSNYNYGSIGVRYGKKAAGGNTPSGTFDATETDYPLRAAEDDNNDPVGIAVTDINGDGYPDIVVANYTELDILINHGDGTFGLPDHTYPIAGEVMIVGDFNEDGHPDIAVGLQGGNVAVILGNGDGTFGPIKNYGVDSTPYTPHFANLVAADMNGDGYLDLVYTYVFGGQVSVMPGNGDGTFSTAIDNTNNNGNGVGSSVAVGDLNNDGIPDVALAAGDVEVQLGNGDGTFQNSTSLSTGSQFANAVAIADFNGDGVPDIGASLDNSGAVFLGKPTVTVNGDGTFTLAPNGTFNARLSTSIRNSGENLLFAVGDVNGDGIPDMVINSQDAGINYVLTNKAQSIVTSVVTGVSVPGSATKTVHGLIATYTGDTFHTGSASTALQVAGSPIPTMTALSVSPSGASYGPVTLTATITPTIAADYTVIGNVTFKDGTTILTSSAAVNSSTQIATFTYTPHGGSHSFTASYTASTPVNYATSTSPAIPDTITQATGTITWTPSSNLGGPGTAIGTGVLDATSNGNGTITYTATASTGSPFAITAASVLPAGVYTLTANLAATTDYTSTSSTISFTVPSTQTISFTLPSTVVLGAGPVVLNATASSGLPVSYTVTGAAFLSSGDVLSFTGLGSATITAMQAGDGTNYVAAAPVTITVVVGPPATVDFNAAGLGAGGSVTKPITITFDSMFTVGSVTMLGPQGASFTIVDPGACTVGATIHPGDSCTMQIKFTATLPGMSVGILEVQDSEGTPLPEAIEDLVALRFR